MDAFQVIGFAIVVLGTGMFIAVDLILAGFGAVVLYQTLLRGAALDDADKKMGRQWHETIRPTVDKEFER